jgi:hypothetical protein
MKIKIKILGCLFHKCHFQSPKTVSGHLQCVQIKCAPMMSQEVPKYVYLYFYVIAQQILNVYLGANIRVQFEKNLLFSATHFLKKVKDTYKSKLRAGGWFRS